MDPNLDPQIPAEIEPIVADETAAPEVLAAEPPAPKVPLARRIFLGAFGLRAGWSLLIYFAMIAIIVFTVRGVMMHRHSAKPAPGGTISQSNTPAAKAPAPKPNPNTPQPMGQMLIIESIQFAVFLGLSWIMAVIERRRVAQYGLGGSRFFSRFAMGAFWGFLAQSILILTLHTFHFLTFDARLLHGPAILGWGSVQLIGFLLVGLGEEYSMRGYLQYTLTRGMVSIGNLISPRHSRVIGFWIASVITSAIFFLLHTGNPGETKIGLFQVFLVGLVFVIALWRTGSLWWAIGYHMAWDWCQSFLYGVPDSGLLMQGRLFSTHASGNSLYSGGTTGPEGSVLCVPIMLLTIVVLLFTHTSPQPPLETLPPKIKSPESTDPLPAQESQPLIA